MARAKKFVKMSDADISRMKSQPHQEIQCSCGRWVFGVSMDAVSVKCPICVCLMAPIEEKLTKQSSGFPRGWKLYAEFVHADGGVFHKGIEDPKLKGTLPPTDMTKIKEKALANKKTKKEREAKKEARLVKQHDKKQELKKKIKEKIAKASIQLTDEDIVLVNAIKKEIILDIVNENGTFNAVDKKKNNYNNIISNPAKLKYAFKGSKKIIGIKHNDTIKWKVYNG